MDDTSPLEAPVTRRERVVPLRAMGIGELLDAAIRVYRSEWRVLMGIVAFVLIPLSLVEVWITQAIIGPLGGTPVGSDEVLSQVVIVALVFVAIQFLIVGPFLVAAITRAAADVYLGEPVGIAKTYGFALRRIHSILWITILTVLATLLGFVLLIIPGVIAFVRFAFAPPVLVVEGRRGTGAMGRSWRLAKGHFWRILGTLLAAGLIAVIVSSIVTIPAELIAQRLGPDGWPVSSLGSVIATVLTTPFSMLVVVLLYFDLRIRKEAFDLEVMAQELAASR